MKKALVREDIGEKTFFRFNIPKARFAVSTRSIVSPEEFAALLKIKPEDLVQAEQVHGDKICLVKGSDRGKILPDCDALITKDPGTPLAVRTADCLPAFIFDSVTPAIGLVHAGWRGTLKGILPKTLLAMAGAFNTEVKNCIIVAGPSIEPCCYEVDDAVMVPLRKVFKFWDKVSQEKANGKWALDLGRLNKLQAIEAGIKEKNMIMSGPCTSCNAELFHSFRRDRGAGRIYSIAMLKEN